MELFLLLVVIALALIFSRLGSITDAIEELTRELRRIANQMK